MSQHGDPPKEVACPDRPKQDLIAAVNDFAASVISDQGPILRRAGKSGNLGNILVLGSIVTAAVAGATAIPTTRAWHWVAVGAAFTAALISSINKTFDFSRGSQAKYYVYTELWGVYSELERLKRDIPYITYDDADQRLQELERLRRQIGHVETTAGSQKVVKT